MGRKTRSSIIALGVFLLLLLVPATVLAATGNGGFVEQVPGKHIYDETGLLSQQQLSQLEQLAAQVGDAGAPTVVYVRQHSSSYDQTAQDAADLMNAYDVQSAPNAHDGLVIFINLSSTNPLHGNVALYAGAKHYDGGKLTKSELQSIYDKAMAPALKNGDLDTAIANGLNAAADQLRFGTAPAGRSATATEIARLIRVPGNILAGLMALLVTFAGWRVIQSRPNAGTEPPPMTTPPADEAPAVAGALVAGRVSNTQIEATLLELARRGALSIEAAGRRKAQIRLLDPRVPRTELERGLYDQLARAAGADGVVDSGELAGLPRRWGDLRDDLRRELEERGLYDPAVGLRRRPGYIAAALGLVAGVALGVASIIVQEPWGLLGVSLLGLAALFALGASLWLPTTTTAGEQLAQAWRAYRRGIKQTAKGPLRAADLNLDTVFPYAVALDTAGALDKRLKEAEQTGYNPAWLNRTLRSGEPYVGFYPIWIAFHSSVAPSGGAGTAGAGAAAGGGAAGGSF